MPNHCYNSVRISGNAETVNKLFKTHFVENEDSGYCLDFNTVIPYPQKYLDMDKKAKEHRDEHPHDWSVKDGFNSGGCEWCCDNWGTKWNSYNAEIKVTEFEIDKTPNCEIHSEFYTAWSPPVGIFSKLCEMYPELTIRFEYEEAGMQFEGAFFNNNGTLEQDYHTANATRSLRGG